MKEQLCNITKHFGTKNQQKKLTEEVHELNEAITTFDCDKTTANREHIAEEMADCFVVLMGLKEYFNFSNEQIKSKMNEKVKRTNQRIEKNYYIDRQILIDRFDGLKDKYDELFDNYNELQEEFDKYKEDVKENYVMKSPYDFYGVNEKDFF